MATFAGTVNTVQAPILVSTLRAKVVEFLSRYDKYVTSLEDVNSQLGPGVPHTVPATRKQCIDSELLAGLVGIHAIPDVTTVDDLTAEGVLLWLQGRILSPIEEVAERIDTALEQVKWTSQHDDPHGSALDFFVQVHQALRKNGVQDAVHDNGKQLIELVMPKLQPAMVRDTMKRDMRFWKSEERKDFCVFIQRVTKVVIEAARYSNKRAGEACPSASKPARPDKKRDRKHEPHRDRFKKGDKDPGKDKQLRAWTLKCLNERCKGSHRIRECPMTSEEDKEKLLADYRSKRDTEPEKKRPKLAAVRACRSQVGTADATKGRYKVRLAEGVEVVALGDYGADYSALPKDILQRLTKAGYNVVIYRLPKPIKLTACIKSTAAGDIEITADSMVRVNIVISLPCGPLRLRRVEFLVVDQEMDEVLLGRPLLAALGFDLTSHLEKVFEQVNDMDISSDMGARSSSRKIASMSSYTGLRYDRTEDDPVKPLGFAGNDIAEVDMADVRKACATMVGKAKEAGISTGGLERIGALLKRYEDVFRVRMGPDPPANIAPMVIKMRADARPVRATQRRYSQPQVAFITKKVKELVRVGALVYNPNAKWASPIVAAPKPGSSEGFRFTVDLRAPNAQTVPMASAMPNLEAMLQTTEGSSFYAKIDMCHAYWQLPLDKESQEYMSIQTPLGVHTPTRTLQGGTDAGNNFQASTSAVFRSLRENLLQWIDDFVIHARSEDQLLDLLEAYFSTCAKVGLKVHAEKCDLFAREVKFCGRIIYCEGTRFDPSRLETLQQMKRPTKAGDLLQFNCATNWMRSSIPNQGCSNIRFDEFEF
jgi:hypothetical protein